MRVNLGGNHLAAPSLLHRVLATARGYALILVVAAAGAAVAALLTGGF